MNLIDNFINKDIEIIKTIFQSIMNYSSDEIIITDEKFNLKYHNTKFLTKTNQKKSNLSEFINEFLNINIENNLTNFKFSDKKHLLIKMIFTKENNFQKIPVNMHICKITNKKNMIKAYLVLIQDITQEIKNQIQKETFIDIISHDLRNPIRANIQILDLILKEKFGKLENNLKVILDELQNSCNFMNYMTENLLIKYRNELKLYELNKEKYSIIKLVKEKCNEVMNILDRKNQTIELTIKGKIKNINIDVKEIGKVINNLLINASEQSRENSKIKIHIENEYKRIKVSFIDFGYTLKQENLEELFEDYISCSNKFRKIGFGLELYNCRKIIEAHNGIIQANSIDNIGTSISFFLPT